MKSGCNFYLDRAAKCLDMAEHVGRQYRGELIQIARGWVQLAAEEAAELENRLEGHLTAIC